MCLGLAAGKTLDTWKKFHLTVSELAKLCRICAQEFTLFTFKLNRVSHAQCPAVAGNPDFQSRQLCRYCSSLYHTLSEQHCFIRPFSVCNCFKMFHDVSSFIVSYVQSSPLHFVTVHGLKKLLAISRALRAMDHQQISRLQLPLELHEASRDNDGDSTRCQKKHFNTFQ